MASTAEWYPHVSYKKFMRSIKRSQIILSILLCIFIAVIPEIRQQIQEKPLQYILVSMSFELIMFASVSWIFGMSRIPANYISLIFLRFYIFFHLQYWDRVENINVDKVMSNQKITSESWYKTIWNKSFGYYFYNNNDETTRMVNQGEGCCGASEIANTSGVYSDMYIEKILFAVLIIFLTTLVTIFSKIDVSRCEWLAISFTSAVTSLSTIILITSMAIDVLGREVHFSLCVCWTILTLFATLFTFIFSTQRLYKRVHGNISSNQRFYRTQAELIIFTINVCATVYYIPLIHPSFSFLRIINSLPNKLQNIMPESLHLFIHTAIKGIKTVVKSWLPK